MMTMNGNRASSNWQKCPTSNVMRAQTRGLMAAIAGSLLLLVLMIDSTADAQAAFRHGKVVVCYLSAWAVYRPTRGSFAIEDLQPGLCTHIVYAFAGLDVERNSIKSLDAWQDLKENYGKGGYERAVNLKSQYPHLKVTLAIGGWNEGSKNYSQMAASPQRRKSFVKNVSEFVRKYNFDGLDLDWEYPTQRGGDPIDRDNFVALVKELRAEFKPHNLLLTSAIGASKTVIDNAYNVRVLSRYLDYMHIMCYDYGGAWDRKITANAPLQSEDTLNVKFTIDYLIAQGASPAKLVLGVPFYGRTFVTESVTGAMGDPASDVGFQGPFTKENGFIGYNELCGLLADKQSGWTSSYDTATKQGIARHRDDVANETRVVTYDSLRTMAVKARYAVRKGLAGTMVWSVDTDDFHGDCLGESDVFVDFAGVGKSLRTPTNYPLLRTLNEAIVLAIDELRQEEDGSNEIPHGEDSSSESPAGGLASHIGLPSQVIVFLISGLLLKLSQF